MEYRNATIKRNAGVLGKRGATLEHYEKRGEALQRYHKKIEHWSTMKEAEGWNATKKRWSTGTLQKRETLEH